MVSCILLRSMCNVGYEGIPSLISWCYSQRAPKIRALIEAEVKETTALAIVVNTVLT